ncbi:MAG: hypothetical protein M1834_008350 [Cirrosporium novae-zelandiae]|nr:MAG: hypothetical protein M1834_008350 [Cirrosporium novae-zelandiae]
MLGSALLLKAPEVNPINQKARSIPALNPINIYGRTFLFSWLGFFIAFWSWYSFPPLINVTIKKDLHLTQVEIANSNIIALAATLLARLVTGPACDRFGPRLTFAGCLFAGSIPTVLAGAVYDARGLLVLRFFVGILGASFVPCQVWTTAFFDKNVVGTANAFTAGLGNAGGGVTYFVMPAVYDSLVYTRGLSPHVAWRVTFIVPFICIIFVATLMLLLCPDTPTGPWSDRKAVTQQHLVDHGLIINDIVDGPSNLTTKPIHSTDTSEPPAINEERLESQPGTSSPTKNPPSFAAGKARLSSQDMLDTVRGELIVKPSWTEAYHVSISPQTLAIASCYFCSFGAELAINSILGAYYLHNFESLGQTGTGNWAAMFGLLNVVFRPLGGIISDAIYNYTPTRLWGKKYWMHFTGIIQGAFLLVIGLINPKKQSEMFGLIAGLAFFLESGNGANFSLVPHVHPYANGIISGITGAAGNLGGIVFAIIFRYLDKDFAKAIWIIGVITIGINVGVCGVRPIPGGQVGGR